MVALRKPGKDDYTQPKAYRPIGLLNTIGIDGSYHCEPTCLPSRPETPTDGARYTLSSPTDTLNIVREQGRIAITARRVRGV